MRLESFRVRNYRSINDSGEIAVSRITALLGRNESGKSNLLRALHSLNPIEGFSALKPIKDFPRHRRLEECEDDTPVLSTTWVLDEDDKEALLEVLPRATDVERVTIGRSYQGKTRTAGTLRPLCQVAPPSRACRARTGRCACEGAACNAAVDPPHSGRSPVRPRRRRGAGRSDAHERKDRGFRAVFSGQSQPIATPGDVHGRARPQADCED